MEAKLGDRRTTQRRIFDSRVAHSLPHYRKEVGASGELCVFSNNAKRKSTNRLRSGMKDLGGAGLRRRPSLSAYCHMLF